MSGHNQQPRSSPLRCPHQRDSAAVGVCRTAVVTTRAHVLKVVPVCSTPVVSVSEIESEDGTTRLEILRQRFRNGTDLIRDHCSQHRSKMQDPATVKIMADMVDDDLGQGSSAWFTRALAVQKQHQTPPEIDFMPPVIGPQWTIIGDYIAGGRLHNVTARSTHSVKSPTKRPRSEKSGAAGDDYSFFFTTDREDVTAETARESTPRNSTAAPATGVAAREADVPGTTAWETETAEVLLVAIQAGAAAAEGAIAGPVMAAGALPARRDTGSATRQGQPRSARSARRRWGTRRRKDEVGAQHAERCG